jgi:hypothetical protein
MLNWQILLAQCHIGHLTSNIVFLKQFGLQNISAITMCDSHTFDVYITSLSRLTGNHSIPFPACQCLKALYCWTCNAVQTYANQIRGILNLPLSYLLRSSNTPERAVEDAPLWDAPNLDEPITQTILLDRAAMGSSLEIGQDNCRLNALLEPLLQYTGAWEAIKPFGHDSRSVWKALLAHGEGDEEKNICTLAANYEIQKVVYLFLVDILLYFK